MPDLDDAPRPATPRPLRTLSVAGHVLLGAICAGMTVWGLLAVYYSDLPAWLRPMVLAVFAAATAWGLVFARSRRRGRLAVFGLFAALVAWWAIIPPSNARDWQPDVAILPYAQIDEDRLTVHNLRCCDYRTETDYDVRRCDRTYDLGTLRTADLFVLADQDPAFSRRIRQGLPGMEERP